MLIESLEHVVLLCVWEKKKVFAFRGLPFFVHYFSILNAWEHSVVCYISSKFQTRICKRPWVDPKMHAFYNAIHKNVHHQRIKITDQSMHFHRPHYECLSPKKITKPDLTVSFVQWSLYIVYIWIVYDVYIHRYINTYIHTYIVQSTSLLLLMLYFCVDLHVNYNIHILKYI